MWGDGNRFATCDGDLFDGAEEVFCGGMSEAVALEVSAHGFVHGVAADDAFEGDEESGGFAVGNSSVGVGVAELEGPAGDGIEVG